MFLVVIGILIALQINTWNDHRIKKSEISMYLSLRNWKMILRYLMSIYLILVGRIKH
ncbi:MAG: hypothetical protein AB8F94_29790 [Saprospiraceae bacterium]